MAKRVRRRRGGGDASSAQLRADIDTGKTVDKVNVADPSAAPLGTDDEAAGRPPSRRAAAQARSDERAGAAQIQAAKDRRAADRFGGVLLLLALPFVALIVLVLLLRYAA